MQPGRAVKAPAGRFMRFKWTGNFSLFNTVTYMGKNREKFFIIRFDNKSEWPGLTHDFTLSECERQKYLRFL